MLIINALIRASKKLTNSSRERRPWLKVVVEGPSEDHLRAETGTALLTIVSRFAPLSAPQVAFP